MPTSLRRAHPLLCLALAAGVVAGCSEGDGASGEQAPQAASLTTTTTEADRDGSGGPGGSSTTGPGEGSGRGDEGGGGGEDGGFGDIPDIVDEVEPSVVTVVTDAGLGSGVVYNEDGIIVTNYHVVERARELTVVFADQTRVPASLVATAPLLDLAILDAERTDLPPATFADELPRVGELAIAIGSPLGLEQTVTAGIVSGLNRGVPGSAQSTQSLVNLIQTDAPISPGNSGGALVDSRARVIGINVAYLPPSAGAVSLGFAIPSPQVQDAVEELLETGQVRLAYIGVVPTELSPQIAERFGLEERRGVLVADLDPAGPAADAGLEPGDLITAVGGEETGTVETFLGVLRRRDPGETVEVDVVRDGDERTVDVTLGDRPPA